MFKEIKVVINMFVGKFYSYFLYLLLISYFMGGNSLAYEDDFSSMLVFNAFLIKCSKVLKRSSDDIKYDSELVVNIRVNPSTNLSKRDKYLLLDEVYDTRMHTRSKLMSPYLIEISHGEPIFSYPIQYVQSIAKRSKRSNPLREERKKEFKNRKFNYATKGFYSRRRRDVYRRYYNDYGDYNNPMQRKFFRKQLLEKQQNEKNRWIESIKQKYKNLALKFQDKNKNMGNGKDHLPFSKYKTNLDFEQPEFSKNQFQKFPNFPLDEPQHRSMNEFNLNLPFSFENFKHPKDSYKNSDVFPSQFQANSKFRKPNKNFFKTPFDNIQYENFNKENFNPSNVSNNFNFARTDSPDEAIALPKTNDFIKTRSHYNFEAPNKEYSFINDPHLSIQDKLNAINANVHQKLNSKSSSGTFDRKTIDDEIPIQNIGDNLENENSEFLSNLALEACRTCGGKNKKKPMPSLMESLSAPYQVESIEKENDFLSKKNYENLANVGNFDLQSCKTCGGKGKKKDENPPNPESIVHYNPFSQIDALVDSVQGICKCDEVLDKFNSALRFRSSSNSCKCKTQGDECICVLPKNKRSLLNNNYSIFNLSAPAPHLTAHIRVFRRNKDSWERVAPAVIVDNEFSRFVDDNFALTFSMKSNVVETEKFLRLQEFQLFVPESERSQRDVSNEEVSDAEETENARKLDEILKHFDESLAKSLLLVDRQIGSSNISPLADDDDKISLTNSRATDEGLPKGQSYNDVFSIGEVSFLPHSVNLIDKCFSDDKNFCLNLIGNQAPAYNIKLKIPFNENVAIPANSYKVKIAKIITDATTKDALQVSVDVINEGLVAEDFVVSICNCPTPYFAGAQTNVAKQLMPHVGETINYLLPLACDKSKKNKPIHCQVIVKKSKGNDANSPREKFVAVRDMRIEVEKRCLCVWHCSCHCIGKLETRIDYNICQKMSQKDLQKAGLLSDSKHINNTEYGKDSLGTQDTPTPSGADLQSVLYPLSAIFGILFLGVLKAFLGLCSEKVNRFGYDYVQHKRPYICSSKCRRFWINVVFFLIFPFCLFCCQCCRVSKEDCAVESVEWVCGRFINETDYSATDNSTGQRDAEIERKRYLQRRAERQSSDERTARTKCCGGNKKRMPAGGEYIDRWNEKFESLARALNEEICNDPYTTEEDEASQIVFQTIAESNSVMTSLCRPIFSLEDVQLTDRR